MKYARQTQTALNRLDGALMKLHTMVKRGENAAAIDFMTNGEMKERFEELQNIITVSATGNSSLGASGVSSIGAL